MKNKRFIVQNYMLGVLTLTLLIAGDVLRRFALVLDADFNRYTFVSKVIIMVSYALFFLFYYKKFIENKKTKKLILLISGLFILYFSSNFLLALLKKTSISIYNIEYFIKYLFFPVTLLVFYFIHDKKPITLKLFKIYEVFFLINAVLIIISFLFEIDYFKSYPNPRRFGYSGFINRPNQLSYITILMVAIYYYGASYLKVNNNKYKLALVLVAALLAGTKRVYFSLLILLLFHLYRYRHQFKLKAILIVSSIILTLTFFKNNIVEVLNKKFELFVEIYNERGLISLIMSFRNELLVKTIKTEIIPKWDVFNVFIGGCDFTIERPEMDLVDLFFYFGLIGLFIYYSLFKVFFSTINKQNVFLIGLLMLLFLTSAITSGFLNSTNIPFIFFISVCFLNSRKVVFK